MWYYDLSYHHVCASAILKRAFVVFVSWAFIPLFGIMLVSSLLLLSLGLTDLLWIVILLSFYITFIFCVCIFSQILFFLRFHLKFDGQHLIVERGWMIHQEISIPIEDISDLIVEQDWFDARQGIATIHLLTPPHVIVPLGLIDGLTWHQAMTLRDQILAAKANQPIMGGFNQRPGTSQK